MKPVDVAISFHHEDAWIAEAINWHLMGSFETYCSANKPTAIAANDFFDFLRTTFTKSRLNVLLWSASYDERRRTDASPIHAEYNVIEHRHGYKAGDAHSLLVVTIDETAVPSSLASIGRLGIKAYGEGFRGVHTRILEILENTASVDDSIVYQHPPNLPHVRGELHPCTFRVIHQPAHGAFRDKCDICVEVLGGPRRDRALLIPSARVPVRLRDVNTLRLNPRNLELKHDIAEIFVGEYDGRELPGVYFEMVLNDRRSTKVYSKDFDDALIRGVRAVAQGQRISRQEIIGE